MRLFAWKWTIKVFCERTCLRSCFLVSWAGWETLQVLEHCKSECWLNRLERRNCHVCNVQHVAGHPRPWALTMGTYFQWHGQKLWLNNLLDTISLKFWFVTFGGSFADTRRGLYDPWLLQLDANIFRYIFCKTNKYVFIAQDLDWKRDIETFQSKWPANKRAGQAPAWLWAVYRRFDCGHNNCTQLHC